jgi:hypothetical protein
MGKYPAFAKDRYCSQVPANEVGFDFIEAIPMTRRGIENESDRYRLELGEARVLLCTYQTLKKSVLTRERIEYLERIYGTGCVDRIRGYMKKLQDGELE